MAILDPAMNPDDDSSGTILPDALFTLFLLAVAFVSLVSLGRGVLRGSPTTEEALLRSYAEEAAPIPTEVSSGEWGVK